MPPASSLRFVIEWYSSTNCSGTALSTGGTDNPLPSSMSFVNMNATAFATGGARSAKFFPQYGDYGNTVDQVYVNTSATCSPNCF